MLALEYAKKHPQRGESPPRVPRPMALNCRCEPGTLRRWRRCRCRHPCAARTSGTRSARTCRAGHRRWRRRGAPARFIQQTVQAFARTDTGPARPRCLGERDDGVARHRQNIRTDGGGLLEIIREPAPRCGRQPRTLQEIARARSTQVSALAALPLSEPRALAFLIQVPEPRRKLFPA